MTAPPDKRPPNEIEAEPFRDYKPTPAKGEPFMAPGGWLVVFSFLAVAAYWHFGAMVVKPFTDPAVDWVASLFR